jgi:hypothetical protein
MTSQSENANGIVVYSSLPSVTHDEGDVTALEQPAPPVKIDLDTVLSIDTIRRHCKIEDVPTVADNQLRLYRASAWEAAQRYTGLALMGLQLYTQHVPLPADSEMFKPRMKIRLDYPVADGIVYTPKGPLQVKKGTHVIRFSGATGYLSNCCDSRTASAPTMEIQYNIGVTGEEAFPAGVIHGMLLFIAWSVEHPGDEYVSILNQVRSEGGHLQGNSNIALLSGALEIWNQYQERP